MRPEDKRPTQRIAVRKFLRTAADYLDEVQFEGRSLIIVRNGREAALVSPVNAPVRVRGDKPDRPGPPGPPDATQEESDEVRSVALTEPQAVILRRFVEAWPRRLTEQFVIHGFDATTGSRSLGWLSLQLLIAWKNGRWEPTPFGERVARYNLANQTEPWWADAPPDDIVSGEGA